MLNKSTSAKSVITVNTGLKVDGLCKEWLLKDDTRRLLKEAVVTVDPTKANMIQNISNRLDELKLQVKEAEIGKDVVYMQIPSSTNSCQTPIKLTEIIKEQAESILLSYDSKRGEPTAATDPQKLVTRKKDSGIDLEKVTDLKQAIPAFYFPFGNRQDSSSTDSDWEQIQVFQV